MTCLPYRCRPVAAALTPRCTAVPDQPDAAPTTPAAPAAPLPLAFHVAGAAAPGEAWHAALSALGWMPVAPGMRAPDSITPGLIWCPHGTELAQVLPPMAAGETPAWLLLSPPLSAAERAMSLAAGVWAWLPTEAPAATVAESLHWVAALAAQQQTRDRAAQAAQEARLDDRKWTERAKGLLMQARGIDEAAAFALLRHTAMQTQSKLPAVARGVVHTSELAEALERAGAQRMLSQRLVKLQALRQWPRLAPTERRDAQALLEASRERVTANLARLTELLRQDLTEEQAAVSAAWARLDAALATRQPDLARSDAAAQQLLDASEHLVGRLSERAGPRPVGLLAQVTRLRLLSQRLAKEGLLAQVVPGHDVSGLTAGLDEFLKAYEAVRATPLASPALQPAFTAVDDAWLLLLRGLRVEPGDAVPRMHQGSERLLQALEELIRALQGSLQLILG